VRCGIGRLQNAIDEMGPCSGVRLMFRVGIGLISLFPDEILNQTVKSVSAEP
jgi:hypothetical protein